MITVKRHSKNNKVLWDSFVKNANNGTIFHLRRFLSYHPEDRFVDHSIEFYKKNTLFSVFPATESNINVSLNIYGSRKISIDTGIGFFDHMLTLLAFWGKWDLVLSCKGDLHVDTHHTIEDTGLALGQAFYSEWRESIGIERISYAFCPLDEALSRVVVDICNRPFFTFADIKKQINWIKVFFKNQKIVH